MSTAPLSMPTFLFSSFFRECYPVVDQHGRVISVLAGTPRGANWMPGIQKLTTRVRQARRKMSFRKNQSLNKRSASPSVSMGTSFGGGSKASVYFISSSLLSTYNCYT